MDEDNQTTEETSEVTTPNTDPATNDAALLLKIEEMIKNYISQIENLSGELTKYKDMIDDIFLNDQTFQEHDKVAKEAARIRSATKQQIMKRPDVADLASKLKDLRSERSELQSGLSDYLGEYQRLSGSNQIEGEDGQMREIVYVAKLVKKSAFRP